MIDVGEVFYFNSPMDKDLLEQLEDILYDIVGTRNWVRKEMRVLQNGWLTPYSNDITKLAIVCQWLVVDPKMAEDLWEFNKYQFGVTNFDNFFEFIFKELKAHSGDYDDFLKNKNCCFKSKG